MSSDGSWAGEYEEQVDYGWKYWVLLVAVLIGFVLLVVGCPQFLISFLEACGFQDSVDFLLLACSCCFALLYSCQQEDANEANFAGCTSGEGSPAFRIDETLHLWHIVHPTDTTEYEKLDAYPCDKPRYVKRKLVDVHGAPVAPHEKTFEYGKKIPYILQVVFSPGMKCTEGGLTHPTFAFVAQKHAEKVDADATQNAQQPRQAQRENVLGAINSASTGAGAGAGAGARNSNSTAQPPPPAKQKPGRKAGAPYRGSANTPSVNHVTHSANQIVGTHFGPSARGGGGGGGARDKRKASASNSYSIGDEVLARYNAKIAADNGKWYAATIVAFMNPDKYIIKWDDGDTNDMVKRENDLKPVV